MITKRRNEEEVLALSKEWANAELQGDTESLNKKLTDDFIGISPHGLILTKEEWINRYRQGNIKNEYIDWGEVKIRIYGDTGITTGKEKVKASHLNHEIQGTFRVTQVFVKQNGQWYIATIHYSLMYETI